MNPYFRAIKNYRNIDDRAKRSDLWIFYIALIALIIACRILDNALGTVRADGEGLFSDIFTFFNIVPLITIYIRRLHDLDRTGWWLLLPPAALVFACLPGTPAVNRYGPPVTDTAGPGVTIVDPPEPPTETPRDPVAEIERLAQLKNAGALTDAEFTALKAKALGQSSRT